jgi:formylglycine-generating enzyme required for sulfatase activity
VPTLRAMANCRGCGSTYNNSQTAGQTAPVGSFAPNQFGLYDMVGNVWEWTEDCVHHSYTESPTDGSAWIEGGDCHDRVIRGGSWDDVPDYLRSATRGRHTADYRSSEIGFRVARRLLVY